jgi:hypothetical protein
MERWRLAAVLIAAWMSIAVGARDTLQRPKEHEPRWARAMSSLVAAPIPFGEAVALAAPSGLTPDQREKLLFEAAWQRPDLRWSLLTRWPADPSPRWIVALPDAPVPTGWRDLWQGGEVRVMARERP